MQSEPLDDLETLMDTLHAALRAGQIEQIADLVTQIEEKLAEVSPADRHLLRRLQAKANSNGQLLEAAGRGIRAAQRRIAEIAAVRSGLATYDRAGQRQEAALATSKLSRRF